MMVVSLVWLGLVLPPGFLPAWVVPPLFPPLRSVGAALLRGEFTSAVRMILGGKEGERTDVAKARAAYLKDGDAKVGSLLS